MHLIEYLGRRCIRAIFLLTGVSILSFTLLELAPGDYFDEFRLNPSFSRETIATLREEYGLNQPLPLRYVRWAGSVIRGEWGLSVAYHRPAGPVLWERAANTLILTTTATILTWLIAIVAVIWAAMGKTWRDHVVAAFATFLIAVPDLVVILGLILVAAGTDLLPSGGMTSVDHASMSLSRRLLDSGLHLVLPAVALMTSMVPVVVLHARAAVLDVLHAPFILSARASGIPPGRLLLRHAFPVAANPLISLAGLSVGTLLNSALVVEAVTGWPGLGNLLLQSIMRRDLYVVVGAIMLSAFLLLIANLCADLLLFVADPRIRRKL